MKKIAVFIWCGLFALPLMAWGQTTEELPGVNVYGRPGVPKITVYVWGQAQSGVWLVEQETDLIELMSVAGRSDVTLRQPERRSITYLRIYREGTGVGSNEPFFEARVNEIFSRNESYPSLQDGDIVVLDTQVRRRITWRDISQIVGTITSGISLYLILDRL